jgi:hypothetical protein
MVLLLLFLQSTKLTRLYSLCLQSGAAVAQATDQFLCNWPEAVAMNSSANANSAANVAIPLLQHDCEMCLIHVQNSTEFCNHALPAYAKKKAASIKAGGREVTT